MFNQIIKCLHIPIKKTLFIAVVNLGFKNSHKHFVSVIVLVFLMNKMSSYY